MGFDDGLLQILRSFESRGNSIDGGMVLEVRRAGMVELLNRINQYTETITDYLCNRGVDKDSHSNPRRGCWGVLPQNRGANGSAKGDVAIIFEGRVLYRLRSGIGVSIPPIESGIFIHPVFMTPYIPGSSIKGLTRYSMQKVLLESCSNKISEDIIEDLLGFIFGSPGEAGHMGFTTFLDAYPVQPGKHGRYVVGDIVTPHYTGREKYEEDANPRPAQVISVDEGVVFEFGIIIYGRALMEFLGEGDGEHFISIVHGVRSRCFNKEGAMQDAEEAVRVIASLLTRSIVRGLVFEGVGGRTTRGYGRLRIIQDSIHIYPISLKMVRI